MVGYATYELAEKLAKLTARQREAINRIVQHVYIDNAPWAELFRGDDKICAEAAYYRKGRIDEATGKHTGFGWGHNPDFKAALDEAVKLALAAQERERLGWLQRAKRRAEESAGRMVDQLIQVATHSELDFARIQAADKVITLAFKGSGDQADAGTREEGDWWAAAGGDDEPR